MGPTITFTQTAEIVGLNDYISITFSSDVDLRAFEARATKVGQSYGVGIGTLVGAFSATPAGVGRTFEIYDNELVYGDGEYRISLFGQSADTGTWNDNHPYITTDAGTYKTADGKNYLCVR